jgi:hypothetical protein
MRYDDWDVILFSRDSHVPIQEFKTACYGSQDASKYCRAVARTAVLHSLDTLLTVCARRQAIAHAHLLH